MHRLLLINIVFMFLSLMGITQSRLGEVASVSISTTNLDSSATLYEKLGFKKIKSNASPSTWVQLSDGSLLITIKKDAEPYIGLIYYSADVEKIVKQLVQDSIVFTQQATQTKTYTIKSPDGFTIVLSNNRDAFTQPNGSTLLTMKPAEYNSADKYPNARCGAFGEFSHPVSNLNSSIMFWQKLGFQVKSKESMPYPFAILSDGLMLIGLHQTKDFNYPAITYFGLNTAKRIQQLKEQGVENFSEMMGKNNVILKTWEGQHFFLFSMGM
jgi:predicted lactoylglutathione lyase